LLFQQSLVCFIPQLPAPFPGMPAWPCGQQKEEYPLLEPTDAPPKQGVLPRKGSSSHTPSLTHRVRAKTNKHFSLFSATAAREQPKAWLLQGTCSSGSSCPASPCGSSASAGILGLSRPSGKGSPVERRGQGLLQNRAAVLASELCLPSGGLGSDTAAGEPLCPLHREDLMCRGVTPTKPLLQLGSSVRKSV